jgi:hypothetical protein
MKFRKLEKSLKKIFIDNILTIFGKFSTKLTNPKKVNSLLQELYPISCNATLIRFGPKGDGGYLIPDDLDGIKYCFSPGVSHVSGFEKECAKRGIKTFLADKSVEKPAEKDSLFNFTKKFIGSFSNENFITIDDWVNCYTKNDKDDLLLQMDIESFEYEVILSMSETLLNRFRIIVIEFHNLDQIWNKPFFFIIERAFRKILKTHSCVHIHPNNIANSIVINNIETTTTMEFTFLRKDRIEDSSFANEFPHRLDYDNDLTQPAKKLPSCWYKSQ